MDLKYRDIARNLSVSLGTVHNIWAHFESTGEVCPSKPNREETRVLTGQQELLITGLLLDNPSLYISEISDKIVELTGIQISASTICRIIHRNGLTRKKIQQIALQRNTGYRGQFMAEVQYHRTDQFVWIDETGSDRKDHIRKSGYALRGERPVYHRILHRGKRISAIAAMASDGIVAVELLKGTVNGEIFYDFVRGSLIPEMQPFDGQNSRSIAILDNCSIHHVLEVRELFSEAGILVFFLPPYSPDYNPIEELFSCVKYYLKDHDEILQAMNDPIPLIQAAFDSITKDKCMGWIRHSGYT
jgi:transposase